jgi:hypothetical protein
MRSVVILLVVLAILLTVISADSSKNNLSEEDKIITNLNARHTIEAEVARIKDIRNTQIKTLIKVINHCQSAMIEDKEFIGESGESAILLLGELRATEAVAPLLNFMCFIIDDKTSQKAGSGDYDALINAYQSAVYTALSGIGKPAVEPLINLLRNGAVRTYFGRANLTEAEKQKYREFEEKYDNEDWSSPRAKSKFVRKTLYLIEGDCAIHYLERAYNSETDKTKKDRLADAITKFKEELKAGAYNK